MKEPKPKKVKLTPPYKKQCQVEKPNGHTFMTLGGRPGLERCKNVPRVLVKELQPGEDGIKGSMSMCSDCFVVFCMQVSPTRETHEFEEINKPTP